MKKCIALPFLLFILVCGCKAPRQVQPIEPGTLANVGYFQLNRTEAIEMINKYQTQPPAAQPVYSLDFDAGELTNFQVSNLQSLRFFLAKYPQGETNQMNGGYTVILQLKTTEKKFAYFDLRRNTSGQYKEGPTVCPPPNCKPIETF